MTFAEKATDYLLNLNLPVNLPKGITIIDPYTTVEVQRCVTVFYKKYYNDNVKRTFIFGINPGRFGSGVTGISFTDPVALQTFCNIDNSLGSKRELSSEFIYVMIEKYGGCEKFYKHFFITALSPLGFLKDNKNYNYYDNALLQNAVEPFIISSINEQLKLGTEREFAICLGKKNAGYFSELNTTHHFFKKIITLEHPRFIMQYRRKSVNKYIEKYLEAFSLIDK
jgi:hypothetical protein